MTRGRSVARHQSLRMSGRGLCGAVLFGIFLLPHAAASPALGAELEGRLFVVTSFPKEHFVPFKRAFERSNPKVKLHIRNKKTSAAISFIQERSTEPVDVFWASAPDAFEVLKVSGHLKRSFAARSPASATLGNYPLDDPEGYYKGFAVSGYGIMWNNRYLERYRLPLPRRWNDLRKPIYYRHIGISAPSRSGTTHLIVEIILQSQGWARGWATILEIGGNLATVTARSYGVRDGVRTGRFGIGLVIDFFALSARATGAPVGFRYPERTVFLPANIAIVKRSPNPVLAASFVDFVLSPQGQRILFQPDIRRLPVRKEAYAEAPPDYPDPFAGDLIDRGITYDSNLSRRRYHLVNSLFDSLVTFRVKPLNRTWQAIHEAEAALRRDGGPDSSKKLARARTTASAVPVSENEAADPAFISVFSRRKPGLPVSARQVELEESWQRFARSRHIEAERLAKELLAAAKATKKAAGTAPQ